MRDYAVLASSPYFAPPKTGPYRVVLLQWKDGLFSVHHQSKGEVLSQARYRTQYGTAAILWSDVVSDNLFGKVPLERPGR